MKVAALPGASRRHAVPEWAGFRGRYLAQVLALAITYYVAAQVGFAFEFAGPVAAIVWLPVGVAISFLYLGGVGLWPGVLVGDLLVNDYSALPIGSAVGQTFGNLLEVLVATLLMRRLIPRGAPLASVGGLARMVVAMAAGATVSATVGALSLRLGAVIDTGAVPDVWRTWWLGDFAGALVVVPVALAWYRPLPRRWPRGRALEGALMVAAVGGASELAFHSNEPVAYLVFPTLIWAALRFGERGATLAITIAVGFAVWNTTHNEGPFAFRSITHSVLATQLYLAVAALSTLFLVAVVTEREAFAGRLAASRSRLVEATDTERRRLGRNLHDGAQQRLTALVVRLGLAAEDARRGPRARRAAARGGGRRGHARHRGAAPDRPWHPPGRAQPRPRGRDQERCRPVVGPLRAARSAHRTARRHGRSHGVLRPCRSRDQCAALRAGLAGHRQGDVGAARAAHRDPRQRDRRRARDTGLRPRRPAQPRRGARRHLRGREPPRSRDTSRGGDPGRRCAPARSRLIPRSPGEVRRVGLASRRCPTPTPGGRRWLYSSAIRRPTSRPTRRRDGSASTIGSAIRGGCCSPIRGPSPRFARPSWATWPASSRSSTSAA